MNKKGQVMQGLGNLGVGIVALSILLVVGFLVLAQADDQVGRIDSINTSNQTQCETSAACNATQTLTNALGTVPPFVPIIVITVIGGLLLLLVRTFNKNAR